MSVQCPDVRTIDNALAIEFTSLCEKTNENHRGRSNAGERRPYQQLARLPRAVANGAGQRNLTACAAATRLPPSGVIRYVSPG